MDIWQKACQRTSVVLLLPAGRAVTMGAIARSVAVVGTTPRLLQGTVCNVTRVGLDWCGGSGRLEHVPNEVKRKGVMELNFELLVVFVLSVKVVS